MKKKILALLLCAVLVLSILPMAGAAADTYLDETGTAKDIPSGAVTISASNALTAWGSLDGTMWYVASGTVNLTDVTVSGDVHLILLDGCNLTAAAGGSGAPGIQVEGTNSLTIYAQSTGSSMGKLSATGGSDGAGIGGGGGGTISGGTITINGGSIESTGGSAGAGIGGGSGGKSSGTVIINGGSVKAIGGLLSPGIGCGYGGAGGNITINGGTVNAIGNRGAAGIGSTGYGDGDTMTITITGGTVTAVGSTDEMMDMAGENTYYMGGAGIGGGSYYSGGNITISGGTVNATGGYGAAGIGGGSGGPTEMAYMGHLMPGESPCGPGAAGGNITISGGSITATGQNGAASIGGGANAEEQGTITLSVTMYDENGKALTVDDLKNALSLTMTDVPPVTVPSVSIAGNNGDKTSFYPGEAVNVAVSIEDVTEGYSVEFSVNYDPEYFVLDTEKVASGLSYANDAADGVVDVVFSDVKADAKPLFTLPFTVTLASGVTLSAPAEAIFAVTAEGSASGEGDAEALTVDADAASVTVTIAPGLTVEFVDADGSPMPSFPPQYVIPGTTSAGDINVPPDPTQGDGYVFAGWTDTASGTLYTTEGAVQDAAIAATAPVTYKATYALDVTIAQYVEYVGGYVRVDVTGDLSGYAFLGAPMYKTGEKTFSFIYSGEEMKTLYGEKMTEDGLEESLLIGTVLSEYTFATAEDAAAYDITETPVSAFNVNGSAKFDVADVRAVFNCWNTLFSVSDYMPVYLRSDLAGSGDTQAPDHIVDSVDVAFIIVKLLGK